MVAGRKTLGITKQLATYEDLQIKFKLLEDMMATLLEEVESLDPTLIIICGQCMDFVCLCHQFHTLANWSLVTVSWCRV